MTALGDGTPVAMGGKPAALLALLVVAHPAGLTAEGAVDAVWPTMSSDAGLNNLRVNLTKLRRTLGTDGVVVFDAGRYHLRVGDEAIDVSRFRAAAADGRAALAAGNVRRAAARFGDALREWRGMAFENVLGVGPVDAERAHLAQERVDALHDWAEALIADERPDEAVRVLLPAWEADRTCESIAEPLILAQRMCRRPVDALATFRATRDALLDEFGMTPSRDFAELEYEILEPVASTGHPIATSRGARFRRPAAFIGRDEQLGDLRTAWREAMAGAPRLALVSGLAGIGKSALIHTFAAEIAQDPKASVLLGTCEQDPAGPYVPFAELVRAALAESQPDTPPALLSELSRLAPELADRLPSSVTPADPAAGRQRLFEAVASVVARSSGPRLVILDDMHWVQPDAVALFRQVLRSASGQVMIVAAYRTNTPPKPNAFTASMEHGRLRSPDLHLHVPPMNRHELVALIDETAPTERRLEFQHHVDDFADISAGNPLAVCEAIRQLELEPELQIGDVLPDSMRSLVARRLQRLGRDGQRTIRAASVIGRVFSVSVVAAVSGVSEDDALDALDEAIASGLITDVPGRDEYTFVHPLIRTAVYRGQADARRLRKHIRTADALAALGDTPHVPEIARHLLTARPVSDARRTWAAARAAGDDALARFAHEAAAVWYESAMTCEDGTFDDVEIAELRLGLGLALDRCSRVEDARSRFFEAAAIARAANDGRLLVRAVEAATPPRVRARPCVRRPARPGGAGRLVVRRPGPARACGGAARRAVRRVLRTTRAGGGDRAGRPAGRGLDHRSDDPGARRGHAGAGDRSGRRRGPPRARARGLRAQHGRRSRARAGDDGPPVPHGAPDQRSRRRVRRVARPAHDHRGDRAHPERPPLRRVAAGGAESDAGAGRRRREPDRSGTGPGPTRRCPLVRRPLSAPDVRARLSTRRARRERTRRAPRRRPTRRSLPDSPSTR